MKMRELFVVKAIWVLFLVLNTKHNIPRLFERVCQMLETPFYIFM